MRMHFVFSLVVSTLGVAAVAFGGMSAYESSMADPDPVLDGGDDSAGPGSKSCGRMCNGSWFQVGVCFNSQRCCGWVICGSSGNSGQNTCCSGHQLCSDGRQTNPPSPPQCIGNP